MSILSKVRSGRLGRAQKIVIYAPEGFGKSTIASQFPAPLFLDIEDSTSQLEVSRLTRADLPDLKTVEFALATIACERPCATLIVDTADWLEQMALDALIAEAGNPKIAGVEDFGYGKGYTLLKERMLLLLTKLDAIVAAGITVVLLAHSRVVKFEPPDGAATYDRYELKLSKQVEPLVKEWADMLLFGNWRTQVKERDRSEADAQFKSVGGKERLLHCNRCPAWDAKNRHGLADEEPWGIATLQRAFAQVDAPWGGEAPVVQGARAQQQHEELPATRPAEMGLPPPGADLAAGAGPAAAPDAELARICGPHAEAVNRYLRAQRRIGGTEDWRSMPADFAARVKRNPAGFLKAAGAQTGKAVAA